MKNQSGPVLHTRDPFTEKFNEYAHSATLERLERKFTPRPYFERYKVFRVLALVASYTFNSFSALTAAALVYFFTKELTGHAIPAAAVTITALVLLEASKRAAHAIIWRDVLQYRRAAVAMIAAAGMFSILSIASSYFGAKRIVQEYTPPAELVNVEEATAPLVEQIAAIDVQISEARATRYKGTTTTTSARTIETLTRQKTPLVEELASTRARIQAGNDAAAGEHREQVFVRAEYFAGITLLLELLFIACAFYLEFYDYRSLAEFAQVAPAPSGNATQGPQTAQVATKTAAGAMTPPPNQNGVHSPPGSPTQGPVNASTQGRAPIGFFGGNALRYDATTQGTQDATKDTITAPDPTGQRVQPCEHCGTMYTPRTTWQKFCTTECRMSHHAQRHGGITYEPNYQAKSKKTGK